MRKSRSRAAARYLAAIYDLHYGYHMNGWFYVGTLEELEAMDIDPLN